MGKLGTEPNFSALSGKLSTHEIIPLSHLSRSIFTLVVPLAIARMWMPRSRCSLFRLPWLDSDLMGKNLHYFVLKDSFSAYKPSADVGAGMGVTKHTQI